MVRTARDDEFNSSDGELAMALWFRGLAERVSKEIHPPIHLTVAYNWTDIDFSRYP